MENVTVCNDGIIKNILSLNYNEIQSFIEYINNVIRKNNHPEYVYIFDCKIIQKTLTLMHFYDNNGCGFKNLKEIEKAFSIADSDRSGTNNMGYGIFSILTIDNNSDSFNIFIQKKKNKSLYGIIHYISESGTIKTMTGEYNNSKITYEGKTVDVSDLEIENGTNSIWFMGQNLSQNDDGEERGPIQIIQFIKRSYKRSQSEESIIKNDFYEYNPINEYDKNLGPEGSSGIAYELGKKYHDLLKDGKKLMCGEEVIYPIDIFGYDLEDERKRTFDVQSLLVNGRKDRKFRIKEINELNWHKFNQSNAIGDIWDTNGSGNLRGNNSQSCKIHISCLKRPQDNDVKRKEMRRERKIFVKLDGIIIFEEEYGMHAFDEIRVIVELFNSKENEVSSFISLNPNKTNSKLNHEFKERIISLIKKMTKKDYFGKLLKAKDKKPAKADRKVIWEKHNGKVYEKKCHIGRCTTIINVFDFQVGHNIPESKGGSSSDINNLYPICSTCNQSMGNKYSIDEWNELYSSS